MEIARPCHVRDFLQRVFVQLSAHGPAAKADDIAVGGGVALLRAGVRLTSLIPPQALTQVNAELTKSGVPIDLTQLKPQHIEDLVEQLDDVTVDVDQPDAKVQVFCE